MDTTTVRRKPKNENATESNLPVHTVREGAVAASIWRRQSPSGFAYFDFSLSRSWKSMSTEKTGYSKNFFCANRDNIVKVVESVSLWIEENTPQQAAPSDGMVSSDSDTMEFG